MAFGKHWEWRGFGTLADPLRQQLEALPWKFPTRQRLVDEYLYVPNSPINVKLRQGDLKFKRLLETHGGVEHWLEDETENHPFPLTPERVEELARELAVRVDAGAAPLWDRTRLLEELAKDGVLVVAVTKDRLQLEWPGAEPAVTVEIAEIEAPERVTSISLEHAERPALEGALAALGVAEVFAPCNYLQAIAAWSRGGTIGGARPAP